MRKYIHIARCMKPKLTEEASKAIADEYSKLRSEDTVESDVARTQPITARTLETLIRLSTAHAKARLSKNVTVDDAYAAIELVQFAYFKRVLEKEKRKRRRRDSQDSAGSGEEDETRRPKRTRKERPASGEAGHDPYEYESDEDDSHVDDAVRRVSRSTAADTIPSETVSTLDVSQGPESMETQDSTPATVSDERYAGQTKKILFHDYHHKRIRTILNATFIDPLEKFFILPVK